jgi:hypothetical protein
LALRPNQGAAGLAAGLAAIAGVAVAVSVEVAVAVDVVVSVGVAAIGAGGVSSDF